MPNNSQPKLLEDFKSIITPFMFGMCLCTMHVRPRDWPRYVDNPTFFNKVLAGWGILAFAVNALVGTLAMVLATVAPNSTSLALCFVLYGIGALMIASICFLPPILLKPSPSYFKDPHLP